MDADFTADGHTLAVAWAAGLSLVDTTTAQETWWQPLSVLPLALDIQAEGTAMALTLDGGSVLVVHTADHSQQLYAIANRLVRDTDIAWSPDNSEIAVQFRGDLIKRIDTTTGQIMEVPLSRKGNTHPYLVWSPDGSLLSLANSSNDCTQLLAVNSGETRFTLGQGDTCYASHAMAWSPDGRLLAVANPAGAIDLIEPTTNTIVQSISGSLSPVFGWTSKGKPLFFNDDGSLLASLGGSDYYGNHPLTVWDIAAGAVISATNNLTAYHLAGAFVGDDVVSLYVDGTLTRWHFAMQAEEEVIGRLSGGSSLSSLIWSEDGRYIAVDSYWGGLVVWDVALGQVQMRLEKRLLTFALSHDGQWLAGVDEERGELQLYEVATGQLSRTWPGAKSTGVGVAFAPDGQLLAYGAGDKVVIVVVETDEETAVLTGYPAEQSITQLRWSPDGTALVAGSTNISGENNAGVNILWQQTADGRWTEVFRAEHFYNYGYHDDRLVLFNPSGSLVAFESFPKEGAPYQIFVYDRQQAAVTSTIESYRLVTWQNDELLLTTEYGGDNRLTQWQVHSGEKIVGMGRESGNSRYTPGGLFFADLSSRGRHVEIRDWLTDQVVAEGQMVRDTVQVFWSPDGRFLAATAGDGTITIWPIQWTSP